MRLYDIAENLYTVIQGGLVYDEDTGEIIFEPGDLERLEADFDMKLEACGIFVKNLNADIEAMKAERNRLSERIRTAEGKRDRLKAYMSDCMALTDTGRVTTARIDIGRHKSYAVAIEDERAIPGAYKHTETIERIDKRDIMDDLKKGIEVPGAQLEERRSVTIK